MPLQFPDGSRTIGLPTPRVGGVLSGLPWENSQTGNAPTIRRTSSTSASPISGNSAVTNLLQAADPVPMGQSAPDVPAIYRNYGTLDDRIYRPDGQRWQTPPTIGPNGELQFDVNNPEHAGQKYVTQRGRTLNESRASGPLTSREQRQAIDMEPWFPPGDPRNNPDVLDPIRVPDLIPFGDDQNLANRPRTLPAIPADPNQTLGRDTPANPLQNMDQSQLEALLKRLQDILSGNATADTRPGPYLGPPVRPQTGLEPGLEPPDYVDDTRPPAQRPTPTYVTRSDRRLKSNIVRIGTHPQHGIGIYDYDIDGHRDTGVMAQELLTVLPAAVSRGDDGFYRVDYFAL